MSKVASRSRNLKSNVIVGYIAQLGTIILTFVGRKIFLNFLSIDYLGINGLFTNVLTVLSLAELGLDSAVVYSLYKPVAENDTALIGSLLRYFRKIYVGLAIGIFAVGLGLIPFLGYIINSDLPQNDLILYYILFLINTVSTYFVAHKAALLTAYQEQRIQKMVVLFITLLQQLLQIVVLCLWRDYRAYVGAMVVCTILNALTLGTICTRTHNDVFREKRTVAFDRKPILRRIGSTLVYKLGGVAITHTDNILISTIVSTAAVGLYTNYYTVVCALQGFIAIVTTSLISAVGSLAATGNKSRQRQVFDAMQFAYNVIATLGGIGFYYLLNDVITLWLGESYLLSQAEVFAVAFNFYLTNAISPIWMFREANGLFDKVKYLMLITAACNIVLSIIMGIVWGVFGILFASALSRILTGVWYEPIILFRNVFAVSTADYWKGQACYCLQTVLAFGLSGMIVYLLPAGLFFLALKVVLVTLAVSSVFLVCNRKSQQIRTLLGLIKTGGK